jgi:hypothetical protein
VTIKSLEEFLAIIEQVDEELKAEDIPISAREIHGWMRIAQKTGENLPFLGEPLENKFTGSSLAGHISRWFRRRDGDRLKVDFSPGSVLLLLRGDLYLMLRLPRVYGAIVPIADRDPTPRPPLFQPISKGIPEFNVLDAISELAPGLREARLPPRNFER